MFSKISQALLFLILIAYLFQCIHSQDLLGSDETNPTIDNLKEPMTIFNDAEVSITLLRDQVAYFQFNASQDYSGSYLIISVHPSNPTSDPDIYVSTANKYPNSSASSQIWANDFGYDMITLPSDDIINNKTIYIGTKCASSECDFVLRVQYANEFYMSTAYLLRLIFNETSSQIIKIGIPNEEDVKKKGKNVSHIILYAELLNPQVVNETFHFYVKQGNDIPSSKDYDIAAETSWLDGKAVIVHSDSSYFCLGCNYTMLIEAPKKSILEVTADLYMDTMNLLPNVGFYDGVRSHKNITYVVNLNKISHMADDDFNIEISPYYGNPKLYVDFDNIPQRLEDYRWSSNQHGRRNLIITGEERKHNNVSNASIAYITVYGRSTCTYKIKFSIAKMLDNQLTISELQTGFVDKGEIINYLFSAWASIDENITITATSEQKANLALVVKSCPNKDNCKIIQNDVDYLTNSSTKSKLTHPIMAIAQQSGKMMQLKFTHKGSACAPKSLLELFFPWWFDSIKACYYAIGIINIGSANASETGSTDLDETKQYTLFIESDKTLTKLEENIAITGHVEISDYNYYVFTIIEDDPDIESITFQVTTLSGDIYLFSSNNIKYPNSTDHDQASYLHNSITYKRNNVNNQSFIGNYYIAIKGADTSSYTITTIIKRQDNITNTPVNLIEGIPQKFILKENETAYAKFNLNWEDKVEQDLDIMLTPYQGKFKFYVSNDGKIPTNTSYRWKSKNGNILKIHIDSEDLEEENFTDEFIIAIYPKHFLKEQIDQDYVCSILYVSEDNVFTLQPEIPFYNFISSNKTIYFVLEVTPDDNSLKIIKTTLDNEFELYLSSEKMNPFPRENNYSLSTIPSNSTELSLNKDDINKLCNWNNQTINDAEFMPICRLSMSAATNSTEDVFVSILYKKSSSFIMMTDGLQLELTYPKGSEYIDLYYYPFFDQNIYIILDTLYEPLIIYVSVIDISNYNNKSEWPFPRKDNYLKMLDTQKTQKIIGNEIKLAKSDFTTCNYQTSGNCVVLAAISLSEPNSNEDSRANDYESYYAPTLGLIITSEITPISPGKIIYSSVDEGAYRYFSLENMNPNSTILISLTPLSNGDADLVISYGADSRPTIESNEFSSSSWRSDIIEIGPDDLVGRKTMDGTWIIGVYGYDESNFELSIIYEDYKIIRLRDSVPFEFYLDPGQTLYLNYFNWLDENFTIKVIKQTGDAFLYISTSSYNDEFLDKLPNSTNHIWSFQTNKVQNLQTITTNDKDFCNYCKYLIAIEANAPTRLSLIIQVQGELTSLSPGNTVRGYIPPNGNETYEFIQTGEINDIDVNIIIYSGNPSIYIHHNRFVNETFNLWKFTPNPGQNTINFKVKNDKYLDYEEDIWNGYEYAPSFPYIFYILVKSPIESNYTIYITTSNGKFLLLDGLMVFGSLFPGESNRYTYISETNPGKDFYGMNKTFRMGLNIYDDKFTDSMVEDLIAYPYLQITYNTWDDDGDNIQREISFARDIKTQTKEASSILRLSEVMNIPALSGVYTINVTNNYTDRPINYSLIMNQYEINLIPQNTVHMSKLAIKDEDIYEIFISEPGILIIEVDECLGNVVLSAAKTYEKLQNKEYDLEVHKPASNSLYGQLRIDTPGSAYLSVRAISGYSIEEMIGEDIGIKEALYKIQTKFLKLDNEFPYDHFIPGDKGRLKWNKINDNIYQISWIDSIIDIEDKYLKDYKISYDYKLVLAKDPLFADSLARCDYMPSILTGDLANKSNFFDIIFNAIPIRDINNSNQMNYNLTLEDNDTYYISLVSYVHGQNQQPNQSSLSSSSWEFPIIYETSQITKIQENVMILDVKDKDKIDHHDDDNIDKYLVWIIGGASFGFVLLILVIIYLVKRYKRVVKRLDYEMQDARNIVGAVNREGIPSDNSLHDAQPKYKGLAEEEDKSP